MNALATLPAAVFQPNGITSLLDVRTQAEMQLEGLQRRDVLSALNVLEARAGLRFEAEAATAQNIRSIFERFGAASLGLSEKRHANLRSLVVGAVDRFGMKRTRLTSRVPLTQEWTCLLARIEKATYRHGVKRLAHYCSAKGVAPTQVRPEHLLGLHEALEAECMTKHPRKIIKHTIAMWNHFGRTVQDWPMTVLSSPFKAEADVLPIERFPESFRDDVARWVDRVRRPDPLDPKAPNRALRQATTDGYIVHFRRFASALVR